MVRFKLQNIGLIEDSEISLNNLTIICGQNNTGKTYITYSIYGFLSMWNDLVNFKIPQEVFSELDENGFYSLDISHFQDNIETVLNSLSRSYTDTLYNVFSVEEEWFSDSVFQVSIDDFSFSLVDALKNTLTSSKKDILEINKESNASILEISTLGGVNKVPHFVLERGINRALGQIFFAHYFQAPFIITSERTGISLFYKELDINKNVIVEHIAKNKGTKIDPFKIFEDTISRYAVPIKDNIDYTRDLADGVIKRKSFLFDDKEINGYFAAILKGSYKVANKEVYFVTKKSKQKIPMYFASSATKSLLELYFYIKHTAKQGDLLIIDEPELNLHPDNHLLIARLLAYLSTKGINIFITTHSDYIIKEFNNLIRLSKTIEGREDILKKYKYKTHDKLDHHDISTYINDNGSLRKTPIDAMGMEVEIFDRTIGQLSKSTDDIFFNIRE